MTWGLCSGTAQDPKGTKIMINLICLLEKVINVSPLSQTVLETFVFMFGFCLLVRLSGAKMHLQQINSLMG